MKTTSLKALLSLIIATCTLSSADANYHAMHPPYGQGITYPDRGFYFETTSFYGFGTQDLYKGVPIVDSIDIVGLDLTLGYEITKRQSVNLRLGYGFGWNSLDVYSYDGRESLDTYMHTFTIMPGYRFTVKPENSRLEFFGGLNVGVASAQVDTDYSYFGYSPRSYDYFELSDTEWGFAYSAEIGLKYHYSPAGYFFIGYEFRGSTAAPSPSFNDGFGFARVKTNAQIYHTIRFGGGFSF